MIIHPIVKRAYVFAHDAHQGQTRKYCKWPYIVHPVAVALTVQTVSHTPEMLAAALLHDVVEDCGVTLDEIDTEFGTEVAGLVFWLTDVSKPEDGGRVVRKHLDLIHTARAPTTAKTIKLADMIDNILDVVQHDQNFAPIYLREMNALMGVLTDGDVLLYQEAEALLEEATGIIGARAVGMGRPSEPWRVF